MKTKLTYIKLGLIALSIMSCSTKKTEESTVDTGLIEITKEQFQTEDMKFGKPEAHRFENKIQFVGKVIPKTNGAAKISAPIDGVVKKISVQSGDLVAKGQKIIEIGGSSMIDLQQQFSSSSARLKQLTAEYNRAKLLYHDSIKVEDDFLKIESNYKTELGLYSALKMKVNQLGINYNDIENGQYMSSYDIYAPISGQIVNLNFNLGQFISSDEYIAEIIDIKKIQVQISVYEKDLFQIKEGQSVVFSVVGDAMEYKGEIKTITKLLNENTKSAECYADILDAGNSFNINQLVNGHIITNVDTLLALPNTAIVKMNDNSYVFAKDSEMENNFQIVKYIVSTGRFDENYTEIKDFKLNKDVLIKGTYNFSVD